MARCNLLKPTPNSDGGTFYTFSQWAEDMTIQNALGDAYRLVPSRFACFNLGSTSDIGTKLQNHFEHKCAAMRHYMEIDTNNERFTPREAAILFWDALTEGTIISGIDDMVYVGDMDLQGTNYIDGVSYSELYCIIPNTARKMGGWLVASSPSGSTITFTGAGAYGVPFGWQNLPSGVSSAGCQTPDVTINTFYSGPAILTTEDNQTVYSSLNTLDSLHQVYMQEVLSNTNYYSVLNDSQFTFNAIALFYDIVAKDEQNNYHYIYTAVPMGMYIPREPITHHVANDDIYGQGTSYGLRVTTKFSAESVAAQNGQSFPGANISASVNDLYPEMSAVMDRFNAAAEALDDYTEKMQTGLNTLYDHMSNFKDNKVNVPYIREIKGPLDSKPEKYWFVNGRSTGVKVESIVNINYSGTDQGLQDLINYFIDQSLQDNSVIDNSIQNYFDDHSITQVLESGNFIQWIEAKKYANDGSIPEIPQLEDYQDIYGNEGAGMLRNCSNLQRVPRLELHNAEDLTEAFSGCSSLKSLYLADTISCEIWRNTFSGCSSLENLVIDATSAKDFTNAFSGCSNLKNLRIYNLDPSLISNLDLSQTCIDYASLESIVNSMKAQLLDNSGSASLTVTIKVPGGTIDPTHNFINDLKYNSQMNRGIKIIIT